MQEYLYLLFDWLIYVYSSFQSRSFLTLHSSIFLLSFLSVKYGRQNRPEQLLTCAMPLDRSTALRLALEVQSTTALQEFLLHSENRN